ncbi:MAG TPA: DCC1-like thiol-disulfide oxidoreductase family protein [Fibrobacteria bacterium]|nr:DCC1-like thiol-disulfide oxidoreductase family protein [Fibrobacteria bacterium]
MREVGGSFTLKADPVQTERFILFFDGLCALCDGFAAFVAKHDRRDVFRLAPLQGETSKALIPQDALSSASAASIVLWMDGKTLRKSDAVLRVFAGLDGGWTLLALGARLVPRFVRDAVYDIVAHNRMRWFGRREACRLPMPDEQARFLP